MTDDPTVIHVDQFLAHPPDRVWAALVDPEALTAWFMPNDFAPVVGHRFTFRTEPVPASQFSGVIGCEVLALREPELLSYSWVEEGREGGLDSVVTWTLRAEGRGTRLFLEHRGFDPDDPMQALAHQIMNGGWRNHVVRQLEKHLALR